MRAILFGLLLCAAAQPALADGNLVRNPSFDEGSDRNGAPGLWQSSGDGRLVTQSLTLERGRDGKQCAKLACTRFQAGNPAAHAMLCQMGVPVKRGKNYRVSFWARGEQIDAEVVSVALSDTTVWANCGLESSFTPTPQWTCYEFLFQATRDCPEKSRFQIWFPSTGSLWLDDVTFEETGADLYRPGHVIPPGKGKNLIPNASFECGSDGWGSAEWDRTAHWGGPMNRLFGELESNNGIDGSHCLKIAITPDNQPVSYFDYYELSRQPIRAPLAANLGFLEVEPGKDYTFAVSMGSDRTGTPALLAVRQFQGGSFEKRIFLAKGWRCYSLTFRPTSRWCYVLAGPDLPVAKDTPQSPKKATIWLDALQLEKGPEATGFEPRSLVEFGLSVGKAGPVIGWDDLLSIRVNMAFANESLRRKVKVDLSLTDFFDQEVWHETVETDGTAVAYPQMGRQQRLRGYLRLHAKMAVDGEVSEQTMRLAVIPEFTGQESRFGVNHAYPWPHLLDLCRQAGLLWVRDWSLKWQEVEPEKGQFNFQETDYQINRPLKQGLRVLGLLPFPSSNWASSAPESVKAGPYYPQNRVRVAYAPRDVGEFENYVAKTVANYQGRIAWWQVFNEPLYTDYSLPRKLGYDGAAYAELTKAFARAARKANPDCRVLAGIGGLNDGQILDDFQKFFAAGALQSVDAVDIHHYPGLRSPEYMEGLLEKLNGLMDKHGGRKPIWLTEYGYYADDDPATIPAEHSNFDRPLASELLQSAYAVRWATIMFAGGVDKIFYHAGTCDGIDRDSLQGIFYEYGGQPHKIYAAQAVLAHLFAPSCRLVKKLPLDGGVRGYLFRDGTRLFAVVWAPAKARPTPLRLADEKMQLWDLMARPQPARQFTPSGTPVYVVAEGLAEQAFELLSQ
jgi:hypothetical protein